MRCEASVSLGCRDINKVMRFYDDSITELYLMAKRWEESWMLKWMGHKNRDVIPTFGWRRTPSRRLSSSRLSIVNGVYPWKKVRETFGRVYRVTLGQYCEWRNWTSSVFYKVIEYERIYAPNHYKIYECGTQLSLWKSELLYQTISAFFIIIFFEDAQMYIWRTNRYIIIYAREATAKITYISLLAL